MKATVLCGKKKKVESCNFEIYNRVILTVFKTKIINRNKSKGK